MVDTCLDGKFNDFTCVNYNSHSTAPPLQIQGPSSPLPGQTRPCPLRQYPCPRTERETVYLRVLHGFPFALQIVVCSLHPFLLSLLVGLHILLIPPFWLFDIAKENSIFLFETPKQKFIRDISALNLVFFSFPFLMILDGAINVDLPLAGFLLFFERNVLSVWVCPWYFLFSVFLFCTPRVTAHCSTY